MSEEQKSPVTAAEPPKADLPKPSAVRASTLKLKPVLRKPVIGGSGLRPGLKLPTQNSVRPGLKLPTQTALKKPESQAAAPAPAAGAPAPMEQLKSVTQKLKGVTQQIPQQAILRKTGIIADQDLSEAQKQAAKSRTARISLSDAIGVAPVNNEAAPMKTIRIKRPVDIGVKPVAPAAAAPAAATAPAAPEAPKASEAADEQTSVTQRKTLKISRPTGAMRPGSKFGIKKTKPATVPGPAAPAAPADGEVADIADIPDIPAAKFNPPAADPNTVPDVSKGVSIAGVIFQIAACVVMGVLGYYLYNDMQLPMFCGGCM